MIKYKISKTGTSILRDYDGETWTTCIPLCSGNRDYEQFVQDVSEQGIEIVEGPDVKELPYDRLRVSEYPSREEQFDMQFHDQVNGTTTWRDTIQAIKDKYPKTITGGTTIGPIPDWVQEAVNAYNS